MYYYHGSVTAGISILQPNAALDNSLSKRCVYLAEQKALAALYIWNRPFKWLTYEILDDGRPVYFESFPNCLFEFYNGVSGFLYTCEGNYPENGTGIQGVFVSEDPVPVISCEPIENTYDYLTCLEREGRLKIRRYEDLTPKRRESDRRMILYEINHLNLLESKAPVSSFIREKFPDIWVQAENQKNF